MSLENALPKRLAEWRPPDGRHDLAVADEQSGWHVTITADRSDVLGCLVWEMTLRRSTGAVEGTLTAWAESIAARVTGLLERLKVVEVDTARQQAQLRSAKPTAKSDALFYYEVLLNGTTQATIRRFRAHHEGGKREQIAFALTHEALIKLVQDLSL